MYPKPARPHRWSVSSAVSSSERWLPLRWICGARVGLGECPAVNWRMADKCRLKHARGGPITCSCQHSNPARFPQLTYPTWAHHHERLGPRTSLVTMQALPQNPNCNNPAHPAQLVHRHEQLARVGLAPPGGGPLARLHPAGQKKETRRSGWVDGWVGGVGEPALAGWFGGACWRQDARPRPVQRGRFC